MSHVIEIFWVRMKVTQIFDRLHRLERKVFLDSLLAEILMEFTATFPPYMAIWQRAEAPAKA